MPQLEIQMTPELHAAFSDQLKNALADTLGTKILLETVLHDLHAKFEALKTDYARVVAELEAKNNSSS